MKYSYKEILKEIKEYDNFRDINMNIWIMPLYNNVLEKMIKEMREINKIGGNND
jgi:hypothetical protein